VSPTPRVLHALRMLIYIKFLRRKQVMKIKVQKFSNTVQILVASVLTFKELERASKFCPESLRLFEQNANGDKVETFRFSTSASAGLTTSGLSIPSGSGKLNLVLPAQGNLEDTKFSIATIAPKLDAIETQVINALAALDTKLATVVVEDLTVEAPAAAVAQGE
jgi:hypothetical protein